MKGDLAGLSQTGELDDKLTERCKILDVTHEGMAFPVEFLSLTGKTGVPIRSTLSAFGPLLLARVLRLSEAQQSILMLVFRFCDDHNLPLLDLEDLRVALGYLCENPEHLSNYGSLSPSSVDVLIRKALQLESEGGKQFFGEPEFDPHDLIRHSSDQHGVINVLQVSDIQDRPTIFSTFIMWLLAVLYRDLPELGDVERPKLAFFFDEAHFLFEGATKAFVEQVEQVIRLIRSKGVGVYFVTQSPTDIPPAILSQLGNRIQHSIRIFTPADERALKTTVQTFPVSPFYDLERILSTMGIGIALVTVLNPSGVPTTPVVTMLCPPKSHMGSVTGEALQRTNQISALASRYGPKVDRKSAKELLAQRIIPKTTLATKEIAPDEDFFGNLVHEFINSKLGQAVGKEIVRSTMGILEHKPAKKRHT
jgi:hypothetical protein